MIDNHFLLLLDYCLFANTFLVAKNKIYVSLAQIYLVVSVLDLLLGFGLLIVGQ